MKVIQQFVNGEFLTITAPMPSAKADKRVKQIVSADSKDGIVRRLRIVPEPTPIKG